MANKYLWVISSGFIYFVLHLLYKHLNIMKKILTLLFFVSIANLSFAQNDTIQKLKALKSMRDSSLISESEYTELKAKVLKINPEVKKEVAKTEIDEPMTIPRLQRKVKSQTVAAVVFGTFSLGTAYLSIRKAHQPIKYQKDSKGAIDYAGYAIACQNRDRTAHNIAVVSSCIGLLAIGNTVLATVNHHKLKKMKREAALTFTGNGISLNYTF